MIFGKKLSLGIKLIYMYIYVSLLPAVRLVIADRFKQFCCSFVLLVKHKSRINKHL